MKLPASLAAIVSLTLLAARFPNRSASDWPEWRGPERTGASAETGLLDNWPEGGPALLWKATGLGEGFSTPSIAGERIFTMGNRDGQEWVIALDRRREGRQAWATPLGSVRHGGGGYPGPRSTPTVDGPRVYALGLNGDLACLNARNGEVVWKRDLVQEFSGTTPGWGYSESVMVDGPWVLCTPGGQEATMLALDKLTGDVVWQSKIGDTAAYSSIIDTEVGGVKQYVQFTMNGVIGVRAKDGELLWRYDEPASGTANISTPIALGDTVFATAGYNRGAGLVELSRQGDGIAAEKVYFTNELQNKTGGAVLVDGHVYGCHEAGFLVCLDYQTGEALWRERAVGVCSLLYADGMFFARNEGGTVHLVKATPEGCTVISSFEQPERSDRTAYPHPVIADGRLYLRDQDKLFCFDVRSAQR
ncbi:MAG: PQQ-binding-like beta-propeller repeat protein [Pirellulales bacterium]